ncbi:MAG TPA: flagellar biosynthesis protein FlhF [Clostridiales bacterium]|nr:MAG: flagellar biosynthesis protein FlhF [Clostridiales bacterium GWD2_32_59]HAN10591.1 flagellar biosynthesis protein FlhF [Clostridiales bacterium]
MKIKKYEGKTKKDVLDKIREELGNEVFILSEKVIQPRGIFKFFLKPTIEVTVTLDETIVKPQSSSSSIIEEKLTKFEEHSKFKEVELEKQSETIKSLENKLDNLENLIKTMTDKIVSQVKVKEDENKKYKNNILQLFYDNLIKNEVDKNLAEEILKDLDDIDEKNNVNDLVRIVYTRITEFLGKPEELKTDKEDGKPKVVAFIGPTGVGKTTTIAKVIAKFILDNKKNVGLITADTYRIAAVEQLKTYAEILGASIEVIYSPDELVKKVEDYKDKELIFLDTAGRSHKNEEQFKELEELVKILDKKEVFLVLSLATKYRDTIDIIDKYSEIISDYKIIFTKMDETLGLGNILNVKMYTKKPLSYITFGQDVPDDIELMNTEKIAKLLLGSYEK